MLSCESPTQITSDTALPNGALVTFPDVVSSLCRRPIVFRLREQCLVLNGVSSEGRKVLGHILLWRSGYRCYGEVQQAFPRS
jgi:hypothetical protein